MGTGRGKGLSACVLKAFVSQRLLTIVVSIPKLTYFGSVVDGNVSLVRDLFHVHIQFILESVLLEKVMDQRVICA